MDAADKDDNKRNIGKIKTMTQYKKNQPAYDAKFIDSNLRVFLFGPRARSLTRVPKINRRNASKLNYKPYTRCVWTFALATQYVVFLLEK